MKVATWNIAGGHLLTEFVKDAAGYEKEDLDYFIGELKSLNADIICLQEAHTSKDNQYIQGKIIADKLGYQYVNHPYKAGESHIKKGHFLSLSILSKYPILKSYFRENPNPNLRSERSDGSVWITLDAGFLVAEVEYEGKQINIANTHLVPLHYFKSNYMEARHDAIRTFISDFLLNLNSSPSLVLGDFNFADLKKMLPKIFSNYKQAFVQETTPAKGQQDHILYSNAWKLLNIEVRKVSGTIKGLE